MTRGVSLSEDLQWVIVRLASLYRPVDIAALCGHPKRTIQELIKRYKATGSPCRPKRDKRLRGRPRITNFNDNLYLQGRVTKTPDMYLDELRVELRESCGVDVSESTVWRSLRRCGYTMKKITKNALEASREKQLRFMNKVHMFYKPEQLVFVDESAADRRTTIRGVAWAIRGRRALRKVFFVRGRRYSILPALSLDGILCVDIIEGSFNTERFIRFVDGLLNRMQPYPHPNSVIVMDNCKIHKKPIIRKMIKDRGMCCLYLPPYSPPFNPVEYGFSAIKAHIRRDGNLVRAAMADDDDTEVYRRLNQAVWSITPLDALGWFWKSGYV